MNEIIQNILTRRSIRTYKEDQISDADLNTVLEAAQFAPTAMGKQGWHFTAVQNKEKIEKLISAIKEAMLKSSIEQYRKMGENPNFNPFYNAPTIVITSHDKKMPSGESDCAAALENMLLAAHSLNIGSCWIHILALTGNDPNVRNVLTELGVPEDYAVFGTAVLGYNSKEEPKAAPRKEGTFNIVK
ncbi:nitroreductase family protein [Clostridium beijerinckii]|uniref:nitroreductase family protein n=1 Tax=Clostridium beijerinckii TaxID=1520 RepID=UPI001494EC27|nr:nitroreductase [Clostridium beijerinckii]MDG5854522.1 nitroreductase [Clostridium beijerinckii]NOW82557.1 nitroreductase [Clostridium beijerinckii]